jgi:WD40 repeat protein
VGSARKSATVAQPGQGEARRCASDPSIGGRALLACCAVEGNKVVVLDVSKAEPVEQASVSRKKPPLGFALSADGGTLATAVDGEPIHLWDLTGKRPAEVGTVQRKGGELTSLRFSPDGTLLASTDSNGWFEVWDVSVRPPQPQ